MCRRFLMLTWDEALQAAVFVEAVSPVVSQAEWPAAVQSEAGRFAPAAKTLGNSAGSEADGAQSGSIWPAVEDLSCRAQAVPGDGVLVLLGEPAGPSSSMGLRPVEMTWGYAAPWKQGGAGLVYNARIESALGKPEGMWGESVRRRRCIVPTWGFFEYHDKERVPSPKTGRPVKRPYLFGSVPRDCGSDAVARDAGAMARDARPGAAACDGAPSSAAYLTLLAGIYEDGRFAVVTCEPTPDAAAVHDRVPLVLEPHEAGVWLGEGYAVLANRAGVRLRIEPAWSPDAARTKAGESPDGFVRVGLGPSLSLDAARAAGADSQGEGGQLSLF